MEVWLLGIIVLLSGCVTALLVKVYVMQKSAREMEEAFTDRIRSDTNTLIDISSRDRYLCSLAASMNVQLKLIRNRTEVMWQLTEELFCYSIVTSTTHNLSYETVSLNAALEECISAYYAVLKHADICPTISMPDKKVVRALDKKALSRILGNVMSNAVKYSDGDLKITLTEEGEIICANHASKLNEVEAGKLFHRFYTVEDARKSTGLGLSIAKTLTEQMGGRIYARYRDGSVFIHIIFEKAQLPAYE